MAKVILVSAPDPNQKMMNRPRYQSKDSALLSLGSSLRSRGHEVIILPGYMSFGDISAEIRNNIMSSDMVAVSCVTHNYLLALKIIRLCKSLDRDVLTIMGGHHVTWLSEQALEECKELDIVVRGEGEQTVAEIADAISNSIDLSNIRGITWRGSGDIVRNQDRDFIKVLPALDAELLDRYLNQISSRYKRFEYTAELARGCPYNCHFCAETMMVGNKYRHKPMESFFLELDVLSKYSDTVDQVFFSDSNFSAGPDRLKELKDHCDSIDFYPGFAANLRDHSISKEYAASLKHAGFSCISFGIDHLHKSVLRNINKSVSFDSVIRAAQICKRMGFKTFSNWIVGLPGDNIGRSMYSFSHADHLQKKNLFDSIEANIFIPYPGTHFYNNQKRYGINLSFRSWNDFLADGFPIVSYQDFSKQEIWSCFKKFRSISKKKIN